jgi:hypothetical protein
VTTSKNVKERLDLAGYVETADNQKLPFDNSHYMARMIDKFQANSPVVPEDYIQERSRQEKNYLNDLDEEIKHPGRYFVEIAEGGRLVVLSRKLGRKPEGLGKKKGDVVEGFSRASRNAFIKLLLSIDYKKMGIPLFYTLTYPGEFSNDPRVWKRDLHVLFQRLQYRFGSVTSTWRLEPQRRGAPHFCGFLWNCDELKSMEGKRWFSQQWFEVVGSGDERHLRAGTGIDIEQDIGNRIFYMAKYQTKVEKGGVKQEFDYPVGRYWGAFNRKELSITKEEIEVDRELFFKLRRPIKKMLESKLEKNKHREVIKGKQSGLWAMMDNEQILKLMDMTIKNMES